MTYQKHWDPTRIRQVLTTESRQKARELFLQTHQPFQRIRVDFCKEGDTSGAFITEQALCDVVQQGVLGAHNRLFLITGEAGCGKSELCQWLEYAADTDARLPVHIPRSMTSAAHVAALLRSKLGGGASSQGALGRAPLTAQADYIVHSAVVLLYELAPPALSPLDRWAEALRHPVLHRTILEHLTAAADGDARHTLLAATDAVEPLCIAAGAPVGQGVDSIAHALRRLLGRAIEQTLWMGDLRSLLGSLSARAVEQGRRPLLLLEDATAFQLLGDRLLDHLLDLTSGHFDAVIGVTTGYERTRLASAALANDLTHIHHRLTARCVLSDEQGRAYGFEDSLIEFTRGYLRAARGGAARQMPFGGDLYPFTETMLRRALSALHEEGNPRHTPRLFLEHVLGAALLADDMPSAALDRSAYLLRPPLAFRSDATDDPHMQSLLRWYGEIDDRSVVLDVRIAEAFGVHIPPSIVHEGTIRVDRAYIPHLPDISLPSADWQVELRELQSWLSDGGIYPSRETLKRGIERVLLSLGDPRSLASPDSVSLVKAEIVYARGDERLPIVLGRESGDQPSSEAYVKVRVQGAPEERVLLEELAYLALSGAGISQICQNVPLTMDWARQHWDAYHGDIRRLLTHRLGGISPELLIWSAWQMICAIEGSPRGAGPAALQERDSAYAEISPWSTQAHPLCHAAGEALLQWRETARRLFIGTFMLRDTLIDRRRIAQMPASIDADIIELLSQIPLRSLKTLPFKIRPGGQNLYGLLAPLQRYAHALQQLDIPTALVQDLQTLRQRSEHLSCQSDVDVAQLGAQIGNLRLKCGEVGVTWRETWDGPISIIESLDRQALADLLADVRSIQEQYEHQDEWDIWRYQQFRHQMGKVLHHPYWSAIDTLAEIQYALAQRARARYRRDGRTLTGTRAYQALLQRTRSILQELRDADQ